MRPSHTLALLLAIGTAQAQTYLPESWSDLIIGLDRDDPRILDIAYAITQSFDQTEACHKAIAAARNGEAAPAGIDLTVNDKTAQLHCAAGDYTLDLTYWKRDNGERLIAALAQWENGNQDEKSHEIYLYDYKPQEKNPVLIPNPAQSRRLNQWRSQDYRIRLPESGQDLVLQQLEGAGGATHYLHWNGQTFADTASTTPAQSAEKTSVKTKPSAQSAKSQSNDIIPPIRTAYKQALDDKPQHEHTRINQDAAQDIHFYHRKGAQAPYFIEVHRDTGKTKYYEEYLIDTEKTPAELRFFFQKIDSAKASQETRLYFDGQAIGYHDLRTTPKNGNTASVKGDGAPPADQWEDGKSQPGEYAAQRRAQELIRIYQAWHGL